MWLNAQNIGHHSVNWSDSEVKEHVFIFNIIKDGVTVLVYSDVCTFTGHLIFKVIV